MLIGLGVGVLVLHVWEGSAMEVRDSEAGETVRPSLTTAPPTLLRQAGGLWGTGQDQGQLPVGVSRPVGLGDHPESGHEQPARVVSRTTEGKSPRRAGTCRLLDAPGFKAAA